LQQQINQQAQNQALMVQQSAQQQSQAQQLMMNQQNNMVGQGPRPMPQQPNQQSFAHLQHQMQASPLPGQQPPQAPMGMPNQTLPQGMTQNQQQQFQVNLEQQRSQQNAPGRPGGGPQSALTPQDNAMVMELTNRLFTQTSEEEKMNLRNNLQQRFDAVTMARYQAQGVDPLIVYFRNQALTRLRAEKQARMTQQQLSAMGQQGQAMPSAGPPMQQQRSVNPSPLTGQAQPPNAMVGNPDFGSFMGNMGDLAAQQQQQGVMAEQAGQMVVPANGAPRNPTPQPGGMAGAAVNANPNVRTQQQILHAQQIQQQRMHQTLQQQSQQAQARLTAQNKAQQMGLQGQPGGMGPGPVPPQQSPAMATLNAPMRTPSQQMSHPDTAQGNPNAKFGAPLDPRFMQGNQRQPGQGNAMGIAGINPAMFNSLAPEQQQQMAALPPEKLQEVVSKWNEARAQAANMQNGRPQMPMQANGQGRPGQQMQQPGQFNPQMAANQFANQNNGQRAPPSMINGMNASQQLLVQQQMANMRANQMPPRTMPMGHEQQPLLMHMDHAIIPPVAYNHGQMPQNIPPEIKKWGQLKHWVSQNAHSLGLPPTTMDGVKQLQTMHYKHLLNLKTRQQQAQNANMQNGAQNAQAGNPTIPPGMAAPVAPMGPTPMQGQNAMNMGTPGQLRQPTQQEINNIRHHPSGKMAGASDDQIRAMFMRNMQAQAANQAQQSQMTPQQQQARQQQMMQQLQMQQRMQQVNAQQNQQSNQPQAQPNAQAQAKQAPVAPPKQPQQTSEAAATSTNNANTARAAPRPPQNARNQGQNSSPAQPVKSLKRASSDDVVEVPNPNNQQARPAPSAASSNQPSQMRVPLTPAQVASLDPEQRKKYEQMLRLSQGNMAGRTMQLDPAIQEKLEAIKREERENFREAQQDIPMDEATRKQTAFRIQQIISPLTNVGKILSRWFQITSDEETARKYCRAVS
jgi:hypothetical protein